MTNLNKETYSKAEVEKLLNEAEEDKLAGLRAKEEDNQKLRDRIQDRTEGYNSYIQSVSENGLNKYWKIKDELEARIKELQLQLEASHPDLTNKDMVSGWSQRYPEIANQVEKLAGSREVVPSNGVDYLANENVKLNTLISKNNHGKQ